MELFPPLFRSRRTSQPWQVEEPLMKAKLVGSVVGLAICACIGSSALAKDTASQMFLTKAIQGNLAEVAMGQLAAQQGSSSDVKAYGQMLQKDQRFTGGSGCSIGLGRAAAAIGCPWAVGR
jgi:Domain of unknown function (DUF4142)